MKDCLESGHRELVEVQGAGLHAAWRRAAEMSARQCLTQADAEPSPRSRRRWLARAELVAADFVGAGIVQAVFFSSPTDGRAP